MTYTTLRKKHKKFIYNDYSYKYRNGYLYITYDFTLEPNIKFKPKLKIPVLQEVKDIDNYVFHIGLIEMISYWKCACPGKIEIRAGHLDSMQIRFFKDLMINGLGEFYYQNNIDFTKNNFIKITSYSNKKFKSKNIKASNKVLIGIGGGKDSIVSLELLKKEKRLCFALNPAIASLNTIKKSKCSSVIIKRDIDEKLFKLNNRGYLNGHTPFSAYLAFLSILLAKLYNVKYIALSNERSANQGNLKYLGKTINHQYSKTFSFENKFRKYYKKHIVSNIEYFSFLRPLYELQIAKIFSKLKKYHSVFLSCNVAISTKSGKKKKTNKWCGKCPKCLFVYTILYPFMKLKDLEAIFGSNLHNNPKLLNLLKKLLAIRGYVKPFECVGTFQEINAALFMSKGDSYLLNYYRDKLIKRGKVNIDAILFGWNKRHNVPKKFQKYLK